MKNSGILNFGSCIFFCCISLLIFNGFSFSINETPGPLVTGFPGDGGGDPTPLPPNPPPPPPPGISFE